MGSINYRGRMVTFDKAYLTDLAKGFADKIYDQVPFLLADRDNEHTMDPERFRGEVTGLEVTDTGLDVMLELTDDAAELVRKNPKLGVSARIIEGLERADGVKAPRVLQHVLGTLDPRVTGMASWEEVALSEEVGVTVDMTSREVKMPEPEKPTPPTPTPESESAPQNDTRSAEVALAQAEAEAQLVQLSQRQAGEIEMLASNDVQNRTRIEQLEIELAQERFRRDQRAFVDAGVPPVLVELARPLLELPATPVIELSNSDTIDVGQIVRDILEETKGLIKLSTEKGHSFGGKVESDKEQADALLEVWAGNGKGGSK
jgi:hypothetical protein